MNKGSRTGLFQEACRTLLERWERLTQACSPGLRTGRLWGRRKGPSLGLRLRVRPAGPKGHRHCMSLRKQWWLAHGPGPRVSEGAGSWPGGGVAPPDAPRVRPLSPEAPVPAGMGRALRGSPRPSPSLAGHRRLLPVHSEVHRQKEVRPPGKCALAWGPVGAACSWPCLLGVGGTWWGLHLEERRDFDFDLGKGGAVLPGSGPA